MPLKKNVEKSMRQLRKSIGRGVSTPYGVEQFEKYRNDLQTTGAVPSNSSVISSGPVSLNFLEKKLKLGTGLNGPTTNNMTLQEKEKEKLYFNTFQKMNPAQRHLYNLKQKIQKGKQQAEETAKNAASTIQQTLAKPGIFLKKIKEESEFQKRKKEAELKKIKEEEELKKKLSEEISQLYEKKRETLKNLLEAQLNVTTMKTRYNAIVYKGLGDSGKRIKGDPITAQYIDSSKKFLEKKEELLPIAKASNEAETKALEKNIDDYKIAHSDYIEFVEEIIQAEEKKIESIKQNFESNISELSRVAGLYHDTNILNAYRNTKKAEQTKLDDTIEEWTTSENLSKPIINTSVSKKRRQKKNNIKYPSLPIQNDSSSMDDNLPKESPQKKQISNTITSASLSASHPPFSLNDELIIPISAKKIQPQPRSRQRLTTQPKPSESSIGKPRARPTPRGRSVTQRNLATQLTPSESSIGKPRAVPTPRGRSVTQRIPGRQLLTPASSIGKSIAGPSVRSPPPKKQSSSTTSMQSESHIGQTIKRNLKPSPRVSQRSRSKFTQPSLEL